MASVVETRDTEVPAKARRRRFTAEYKQRILREADRCQRPGEIGALLRREGLYSSHLTVWRSARERAEREALRAKRRGPKPKARDGRLPARKRARSDQCRPATFAFLGFTHYCGWTRYGAFIVKRKTERTRLTQKLRSLRLEARRRRHAPLVNQHRWLAAVLRGHYAYYGLPSNHRSLSAFRHQVMRLWHRALQRRSQRGLTWHRFQKILELFPLPEPRITHSREALGVVLGRPSRGAECGKAACSDL